MCSSVTGHASIHVYKFVLLSKAKLEQSEVRVLRSCRLCRACIVCVSTLAGNQSSIVGEDINAKFIPSGHIVYSVQELMLIVSNTCAVSHARDITTCLRQLLEKDLGM